MPEMNGFEVCQQIKSGNRNMEVPIIFLTAKTEIENIQKAFQFGGVDYVNKPFRSAELLARVKTHVELKVSKEKLKEVNLWLEEKVEARTEELNIANKKLMKLDEAKSLFLQIISHEIRTPLNGILGGLSLIKTYGLSEESITFLDMLDQSAKRLEDFSCKALDISLFNARGEEVVRQGTHPISEILSKVITNLGDMSKEKQIKFKQTIETGSEMIDVDSKYFDICMFNVLHNAVKYSPSMGIVPIDTYNENNRTIVEIRDEGIGFKKGFFINDVELFESEKHVDNNPGLGLFLSNQIIKAHGGTIENGNNKNKGAFVKISIPAGSD